MRDLDRLDWPACTTIVTYGLRLGVRASDPTALGLLAARFPPIWKPDRSPFVDRLYSFILGGQKPGTSIRRLHILYGDVERLARARELQEALNVFESHIQHYVAEAAPRKVFVHAGVVGWGGGAIVIPGRSASGKSTLVAALVRAGATHYSDEYAVLDSKGYVHAYPRALKLGQSSNPVPTGPSVEQPSRVPGLRPIPVRLVLATAYKKGARWRPRYLSPGRAVLEMMANALAARRRPVAVLSTLRKVASTATSVKGARGEADEVVSSILAQLDDCR